MKHIIIFACLAISIVAQAQTRKIDIQLGEYKCGFRDDLKDDAVRAFKIMSDVFSSQQFQDSLAKLTFKCSNACPKTQCADQFSGPSILNALFSKTSDSWNLKIKRSAGALGETVPYTDNTIAYQKNISKDMCNLPFDIALAVNLCHEYFHHIGYCHPRNPKDVELRKPKNGNECDDEYFDSVSYKEDIAYRVGWIAYDILLDWYKRDLIK